MSPHVPLCRRTQLPFKTEAVIQAFTFLKQTPRDRLPQNGARARCTQDRELARLPRAPVGVAHP